MSPELSLENVAILKEAPHDVRKRIAEHCKWHHFGGGSSILEYLDDSRDVYFLAHGNARAVLYSPQGKAVSYRDLADGSTFGEIAAIDGGPRSVSIEAVGPCKVAVLSEKAFWDAIADHPDFAKAVLRHLARYVRDLTERIFEFSTLAVNNRLHAELLRLAEDSSTNMAGKVISPLPTHTELASRLSTHREAVSREFSRLAAIGVIERVGRTVRITDIQRLTRMVREGVTE